MSRRDDLSQAFTSAAKATRERLKYAKEDEFDDDDDREASEKEKLTQEQMKQIVRDIGEHYNSR